MTTPSPMWPGTGLPPDFDHIDPARWDDAVVDVTTASAGVRVPEQANRIATLRVKFAADAANSGPLIVQRGVGLGGAQQPPFSGTGAYTVPAGQHFWAEGPVEQWWVKAPLNADVLHVTGKRT